MLTHAGLLLRLCPVRSQQWVFLRSELDSSMCWVIRVPVGLSFVYTIKHVCTGWLCWLKPIINLSSSVLWNSLIKEMFSRAENVRPLDIRKWLFTVRVVDHRLLREAVESPSVEMFKAQQDAVLDHQLQVALLEQEGGPDVPRGPWQPQLLCGKFIIVAVGKWFFFQWKTLKPGGGERIVALGHFSSSRFRRRCVPRLVQLVLTLPWIFNSSSIVMVLQYEKSTKEW